MTPIARFCFFAPYLNHTAPAFITRHKKIHFRGLRVTELFPRLCQNNLFSCRTVYLCEFRIIGGNTQRIMQGLAAGMPQEDIPLIRAEWFMDSFWY